MGGYNQLTNPNFSFSPIKSDRHVPFWAKKETAIRRNFSAIRPQFSTIRRNFKNRYISEKIRGLRDLIESQIRKFTS